MYLRLYPGACRPLDPLLGYQGACRPLLRLYPGACRPLDPLLGYQGACRPLDPLLGYQGACRPLDPLLDAPRLSAAARFVFTRGRAAPWTPCPARRGAACFFLSSIFCVHIRSLTVRLDAPRRGVFFRSSSKLWRSLRSLRLAFCADGQTDRQTESFSP